MLTHKGFEAADVEAQPLSDIFGAGESALTVG
jgi:hypothetical protein